MVYVEDGTPELTINGSGRIGGPIIFTGRPGQPRPRVDRVESTGCRQIWLIGLEIRHLRFVGTFQDILIEDCLFAGNSDGDNLLIQTFPSGRSQRIAIRRCIITFAKRQGLFAKWIDQLLIEECLFDHNGWPPEEASGSAFDEDGQSSSSGDTSGGPTMFNHNIYLKECRDVVIRGNVLARGSSFGLKISSDRTGGMVNVLVEDNLFLGDANGITVGRSGRYADYATRNLTFRRNVFTELGRTLNGQAQAIGIHLTSVDGGVIERNFFIYKDYPAPHAALELEDDHPQRNIAVRNNVVYRWHVNNDGNPWRVTSGSSEENSGGGDGSDFQNVTSTGDLIEPDAPPALRTADEAARLLGHDGYEAMLEAMRQRRRSDWPAGLTPAAAIEAMVKPFQKRLEGDKRFLRPAHSE
ncbi:MAG TPA: right-handed parallel beta-helix repeat-containing protein [Phycisphaeraceae bacterium]